MMHKDCSMGLRAAQSLDNFRQMSCTVHRPSVLMEIDNGVGNIVVEVPYEVAATNNTKVEHATWAHHATTLHPSNVQKAHIGVQHCLCTKSVETLPIHLWSEKKACARGLVGSGMVCKGGFPHPHLCHT